MKTRTLIKSWDDVDKYLDLLIKRDLEAEALTTGMNEACRKIKSEHGEYIKGLEIRNKEILESMEVFFIDHEDDPEVKGKTFEGMFGKCGLRLTPPSVKPLSKMTWEKVLSRILDLGYKTKLLRPVVPSVKDIDREFLASEKVNDDLRKEIGVRLHQEERFWYEPK